ncbi:hypothetical protein ACG02S_19995 [Roseateles sp. DC23W]|uniref:Uncharacterized protein n=1 Tax=Pelomonas dachongensis TaxID=3299029 RepID=A0ABW7EVD7_9BURK
MKDADRLTLFGTLEPTPPVQLLQAGRLSCELVDGQVRNVRWDDVEVVRGISYLLRDQDWGTVAAVVEALHVEQQAHSFSARCMLRMTTPQGELRAAACLSAHETGSLRFEVSATPDADLATNRCGFVVLHPADAAGRRLRVGHCDGTVSDTQFPRDISPSQPVFAIRRLAYAPRDGIEVELLLQAELPHDPLGKFEMEDQRNWSDASFKTYVASLRDPWPYRLPAGQALTQRIELVVSGNQRPASTPRDTPGIVIGPASHCRMPALGIGVPPGLARAQPEEVAALRGLGASWWIAEADLREDALTADLQALAIHRSGLDVRVQLDLIADDAERPEAAAAHAARLCEAAGLRADAVRLLPAAYLKSFQPEGPWPSLPPLEAYAAAARHAFPGAQIGGGMYTSFTELNRRRPSDTELDFIGHLTCPTVHGADDHSVMQTHECLPHIVRSVRNLWPTLPYRLGPSSIAPRRNPYGQNTALNAAGRRLPLASADPRHGASFGAAWTVGYAASVAPLGLEVLALLDSHGPHGPKPHLPCGLPAGSLTQAWVVLQYLASAVGARYLPLLNLPDSVVGMAWTHDDVIAQGVIANLGHRPVSLRWKQRPLTLPDVTTTVEVLGAYQTCGFTFDVNPSPATG